MSAQGNMVASPGASAAHPLRTISFSMIAIAARTEIRPSNLVGSKF